MIRFSGLFSNMISTTWSQAVGALPVALPAQGVVEPTPSTEDVDLEATVGPARATDKANNPITAVLRRMRSRLSIEPSSVQAAGVGRLIQLATGLSSSGTRSGWVA